MDTFQVTPDNAQQIVFIIEKHPDNKRGILKDRFGIDDKGVDKIIFDYENGNKFKTLLPKKKRRLTRVHIDCLRLYGAEVDKDNMNIALPHGVELSENAVASLEALKKIGYTQTMQTFI